MVKQHPEHILKEVVEKFGLLDFVVSKFKHIIGFETWYIWEISKWRDITFIGFQIEQTKLEPKLIININSSTLFTNDIPLSNFNNLEELDAFIRLYL